MKQLIIILSFIPFALSAQVKLNTTIPAIYWMSDTSTTSTGTFKTSTALVKKKGFVVYKQDAAGLITYSYLDASKKALDKKYFVAFDDKGAAALNSSKSPIDTSAQTVVFKMASQVAVIENKILTLAETIHAIDSVVSWKMAQVQSQDWTTVRKDVGFLFYEKDRLTAEIIALKKTIPPLITTKVKDGLAVDSSGALILDPVLLALLKKLFNLQ